MLSVGFVCFILIGVPLVIGTPVVNILNGTLKGSRMEAGFNIDMIKIFQFSSSEKEFFAFRGIPYALPPVGELRFQVPHPSEAWNGTRSAEEDANICIQEGQSMFGTKYIGSEDCLYLNVYTPRIPTNNSENKMPVMVWFHGGAFSTGSGNSEYYNPKYFLNYDIVFVGINYRLGALGFLSTGDLTLPGNLAMKDQVQALRWVQENIHAFGGDPTSVTIFGESSGAVNTHLHMMSPLSKGLYHRVISQSGTGMNLWAVCTPGRPRRMAMRVAHLLNCPSTNSTDIVTCLRTKSAEDIVKTYKKFLKFGSDPIVLFTPVIEPEHPGAFLSKSPYELLSTERINDVPWLTGLNSHEGAFRFILMDAYEDENALEELNSRWNELAPLSLAFKYSCKTENQTKLAMEIRKFYLGDKNISESTKPELIDMYSDFCFRNGLRESLNLQRKYFKSPIYRYRFAYEGMYSYASRHVKTLWKNYGVSHADELIYFFPMQEVNDLISLPTTEKHNSLVKIMTTMWYNFAKTGNPTPEIAENIPVKWEPITTDAHEYLNIESPSNLTMMKDDYSKKAALWNSLPACVRINTRRKKNKNMNKRPRKLSHTKNILINV